MNTVMDVDDATTKETTSFFKQRRYAVVAMLVWGTINYVIIRVNLSIAIIAMTKNITSEDGEVLIAAPFNWDSKEQGIILSAFYYGTAAIQIPAGMLAKKFSPTKVYCIAIGIASVLSCLTPLVAVDFYAMVLLRVAIGLASGVIFPAGIVILSGWAPPMERSRMTVIADSGLYIGMIFGLQGGGILCEYLGWDTVFYATGAFGLLWCMIWTIYIRDSPDKDKRITDHEKRYILDSIGKQSQPKYTKIPWCAILTSIPCWAITSAHVAYVWGLTFISTQMPTYLSDIFNFHLTKTGFFSCLPYILTASMSAPAGFLADFLQKKAVLTTLQVRRLFTCTPFLIKLILMFALTLTDSWTASVIFLTLTSALDPYTTAGYYTNSLDVAGPYSGIVISVANTMGASTGIITPTLTGFVVQNKTKEQWDLMFYSVALTYGIGCILYGCLSSSELQSWAKITKAAEEVELKEKTELSEHTNNDEKA